ncbi:probable E3 ubiquitin-protein ligase TRIML1 [Dromiciops gliroides]|uniref:probable E3 ubiquitin-protein ligase TRIML1 n=1 Tax=Dromiciops gliroides TaxID=33562 RepID=UPI001CC35A42|nr:probable E3 ubiquitin-protein ligase TRIML1 [Dromiciops gliroides]
MDAKDLIEKFQACLTCSVCLGYFTDPVTLKCGHSFCTGCLKEWREEDQETVTCPECREVIKVSSNVVTSRTLQDLSITVEMLRPHLLSTFVGLTACEQHKEKEKLFCEEDRRTLCDSCSLAPEHQDHQVLPLEEAVAKCKKKLQETKNLLDKKSKNVKESLDWAIRSENRSKEDAFGFQQLIRAEYEKMHQFLWDEEILQMQKLAQQYRDNLVKFGENKAKLSQQSQNLQLMAFKIEENLDKGPLEMLQNMEVTLKRSEKLLLQEPEVAVPDWTTFPIIGLREMLMSFYRDITLDPETAHPHLIVSKDLKSVKYGDVPQDLPDNKERFLCALIVLGSQTFTSGKHYWEVEVGTKTEWEVGICEDSVSRKMKHSLLPEDIRTLAGCTFGNDFFLWNSQGGYRRSPLLHKVQLL